MLAACRHAERTISYRSRGPGVWPLRILQHICYGILALSTYYHLLSDIENFSDSFRLCMLSCNHDADYLQEIAETSRLTRRKQGKTGKEFSYQGM